jgi:hypothetical protein
MHRSIRVHRRIRRYALWLNLIVGVFWRRFSVYLRRNRPKLYWRATAALAICFGALFGYLFVRFRSELVMYAEVLSGNGTLSQLGIAVGAAMLGVIGIVFSLNLFSIQQVAERGTILTLREYANDWFSDSCTGVWPVLPYWLLRRHSSENTSESIRSPLIL